MGSVFLNFTSRAQLIFAHRNPIVQISSVHLRSSTTNTPSLRLEVSHLAIILMACAVAIVFDVPPGRLFRPTSMPSQSTWISPNNPPHDPLLTYAYWYTHPTHSSGTRLGFHVPIRVCPHQFLTNLMCPHTSQGMSTPNRKRNLVPYRILSTHIRTFRPFFSITTSGCPVRPSQEKIMTYFVTLSGVMTSTWTTSRRRTSARSRRSCAGVRLTMVGNRKGVGGSLI